jgi:hypothetical protein
MSDKPRTTLMGCAYKPDGTPVIVLKLDAAALDDLNTKGAVIVNAPRDTEGRAQVLVLWGPDATEAELKQSLAAARLALLPELLPLSTRGHEHV